MTTIHQTKTGTIELIHQYKDGQDRKTELYDEFTDNILIVLADTNHTIWKFTGNRQDAAITASAFDLPDNLIGILDGNRVTFEAPPDNFWIDADTGQPPTDDTMQLEPDLKNHPHIVAW